jgi:hydroxymethylpyrimidine/phosphomethylpyrimidine kinase
MTRPRVLTLAGSDPSGGAGLQADLKAFQARGVDACAVPTALTVQTPRAVISIQALDPAFVVAQLDALLNEVPLQAIKIGMLCNGPLVRAVTTCLQRQPPVPLVVDPIIISTSGFRLMDDDGVWALVESLLSQATLVTPNADEASCLSRMPVRNVQEARLAAIAIQALGAQTVLVKGGHLRGDIAADVLFDGNGFHVLESPRLPVGRTHGTGCLLSSVIAAELAKGQPVLDAVTTAKACVRNALQHGTHVHGVLLPSAFALYP